MRRLRESLRLRAIIILLFITGGNPAWASLSESAPSALAWNLNDVSYLYPLDPKILLKTHDHGPSKGELLPVLILKEYFKQILSAGDTAGKYSTALNSVYRALRVVSFRVDPQNRELRFVWQPVFFHARDQKWIAEDASVHTFYSLTEQEFSELLFTLWRLKVETLFQGISTHFKPLGVHPAFLNQSTHSIFLNTLSTLILKLCGEQNLKQVTVMTLVTPQNWWKFMGVKREGFFSPWRKIEIPRIAVFEVDIFNHQFEKDIQTNLDVGVEVEFKGISTYPKEDDLRPILNLAGRGQVGREDFLDFKRALGAVYRFQNPKITNPNNLDCAHCHYADPSRFFILRSFPELSQKQSNKFYKKDQYQNPEPQNFNLFNPTIGNQSTKILRAFGYFGAQPAINQRVIHDSAESAHFLNLK